MPSSSGGPEEVLVGPLHLDRGAVAGQHLDVQAQGLHLLDQHLNDSGMPGSGMFSPLTIASYTLTRPWVSSDLMVRSSCRA